MDKERDEAREKAYNAVRLHFGATGLKRTRYAFNEGFDAGYEAGAGRWIPVSERLPEGGKWYLVTIRVRSNDLDVVRDFYSHGHWYTDHEILAWMSLPEPYEPALERK